MMRLLNVLLGETKTRVTGNNTRMFLFFDYNLITLYIDFARTTHLITKIKRIDL